MCKDNDKHTIIKEEDKYIFIEEEVCGTCVWFAPKPFDTNEDKHKRGVCINGNDFLAYIDTRKGRKACPYYHGCTYSLEDIAVWLTVAMEAQGTYETSQEGAMQTARDYADLAKDLLSELGIKL